MKKPAILAIILLVVDQVTKYLTDKFVPYGANLSVISYKNLFNITNVHNTGAAFSILQGKNFLFIVMIIIFLFAIGYWIYKNNKKLTGLQKYAFCLVVSGGAGNLIDRIFRGAVIDFLDFGINSLRWPSFNIADSIICIAVVLIFLDILFFNKKEKEV